MGPEIDLKGKVWDGSSSMGISSSMLRSSDPTRQRAFPREEYSVERPSG